MGTMYVAHILFCSLVGQCEIYHDKQGPSVSYEQCQVKLDEMNRRVKENPAPVEAKIGKYDVNKVHRGFCIDMNNSFHKNWEVYYNL